MNKCVHAHMNMHICNMKHYVYEYINICIITYMSIWKYEYEMYAYRNKLRKYEFMKKWKYYYVNKWMFLWSNECITIWIHELNEKWTHRYMNSWIIWIYNMNICGCKYMNRWTCGYMDLRKYKYMGIWIHGYIRYFVLVGGIISFVTSDRQHVTALPNSWGDQLSIRKIQNQFPVCQTTL